MKTNNSCGFFKILYTGNLINFNTGKTMHSDLYIKNVME